jgi:cation:H+ antiporter
MWNSLLPFLLMAPGLFLLCKGADWLVSGASGLGIHWGLSPLVVGLVIVGFGTSSPELAVSIGAVFSDKSGLATGNVLGSNIFNIALIGGLCAVIVPLKVGIQIIRLDAPLLIGASLLTMVLLFDGALTRVEGVILFSGLLLWTGWIFFASRKETIASSDGIEVESADSVKKLAGLVLLGLFLLVLGSHLLVDGASRFARELGVSEMVIGFTVVAAGTSLPELASSLVAARRNQCDLALGNIIGSNLFNLLGILGLTALIQPFAGVTVRPTEWVFFIGTAVLVLPLMWTGFVVRRWEGAVLLSSFLAYLYFIWPH